MVQYVMLFPSTALSHSLVIVDLCFSWDILGCGLYCFSSQCSIPFWSHPSRTHLLTVFANLPQSTSTKSFTKASQRSNNPRSAKVCFVTRPLALFGLKNGAYLITL